jgi:hypothetical protein
VAGTGDVDHAGGQIDAGDLHAERSQVGRHSPRTAADVRYLSETAGADRIDAR